MWRDVTPWSVFVQAVGAYQRETSYTLPRTTIQQSAGVLWQETSLSENREGAAESRTSPAWRPGGAARPSGAMVRRVCC